MEDFISTLVWAAIIQGLFLVLLYLFSKKHQSFANRLLGLFLLVIIYEGTLQFMPFDYIFGYSLFYFALPEVKLFYPILFFHYILEKVGRSKFYWKFLKIHYLLAFAVMGITLINVGLYLANNQKIEEYFGMSLVSSLFMAQQYYAFILIIICYVLTLLEIKRYKVIVHKEYSDYAMLNINWLWRFVLTILPIILLWGAELIRIILGAGSGFDFELVTWGAVVVLIYFISYQAFRHKNLFEGIEDDLDKRENGSWIKEKKRPYSNDYIFSEEKDAELIQFIKSYMEKEEPYLNASLSMFQLSRLLKIPERELSLLINHKLNKHFFDFINEYRIKKAMLLLSKPENRNKTVLEILYRVGFNSKSSFNTVFKKITGQTPSQYRKNSLVEAKTN